MKSIIAYAILLSGIAGSFGIMSKEKTAKINKEPVVLECSGGMAIDMKGNISQEEMICLEK